ncbi:MAG: hypothetical protein J0M12_16595 [Deltaproteobacteria bacterium]|nr:hypothetical protein [Deltaproteobacteria bacterium]
MPCYKCNAEDGTEVRLCPKCNSERQEERKSPFPDVENLPPEPLLTPSRVLVACAVTAAVCLSFFIICYAPFGPGYGLSIGEQAYRRCLKTKQTAAEEEAEKTAKEKKRTPEPLNERALYKITAACDALRTECDRNPGGKTCRAAF